MNVLPMEKKTLILSLLCEGSSVRATSRIADVSPVTVLKLLLEAGEKAKDIQDSQMVNIQSNYNCNFFYIVHPDVLIYDRDIRCTHSSNLFHYSTIKSNFSLDMRIFCFLACSLCNELSILYFL